MLSTAHTIAAVLPPDTRFPLGERLATLHQAFEWSVALREGASALPCFPCFSILPRLHCASVRCWPLSSVCASLLSPCSRVGHVLSQARRQLTLSFERQPQAARDTSGGTSVCNQSSLTRLLSFHLGTHFRLRLSVLPDTNLIHSALHTPKARTRRAPVSARQRLELRRCVAFRYICTYIYIYIYICVCASISDRTDLHHCPPDRPRQAAASAARAASRRATDVIRAATMTSAATAWLRCCPAICRPAPPLAMRSLCAGPRCARLAPACTAPTPATSTPAAPVRRYCSLFLRLFVSVSVFV
jgi:hypothetical protein